MTKPPEPPNALIYFPLAGDPEHGLAAVRVIDWGQPGSYTRLTQAGPRAHELHKDDEIEGTIRSERLCGGCRSGGSIGQLMVELVVADGVQLCGASYTLALALADKTVRGCLPRLPGRMVIASGVVKRDGAIAAVGRIDEKLAALACELARRPLAAPLLVLAQDSLDALTTDERQRLHGLIAAGVQCEGVAALADMRTDWPGRRIPSPPQWRRLQNGRRWVIAAVLGWRKQLLTAVIVVTVAIGYYVFNYRTLAVVKAGTGSGAVGGGGTYRYGAQVLATARPAPRSTFHGWTPASCGGAFALTADTTCTATFDLEPQVIVAAGAEPGPTLTDAGPANCVLVVARPTATTCTTKSRDQAVRKGMTWATSHDIFLGIDHVGCSGCNPYHGDTDCSVALPVLCLKIDGSPRPNYAVPASCPNLAMSCDYYNGWAEGAVAATVAVAGVSLGSATAGDAICQRQFGAGWRMAEFHDGRRLEGMGLNRFYGSAADGTSASALRRGSPVGSLPFSGDVTSESPWPTTGTRPGGWNFYAYGNLSPDTRYWVKVIGQPSNCWD